LWASFILLATLSDFQPRKKKEERRKKKEACQDNTDYPALPAQKRPTYCKLTAAA